MGIMGKLGGGFANRRMAFLASMVAANVAISVGASEELTLEVSTRAWCDMMDFMDQLDRAYWTLNN